MSIDYEVWSANPLTDTRALPRPEQWAKTQSDWAFRGKDWQIIIDQSAEVEEDDLPTEIAVEVAGARYLTRITLEPIGAPKSAHSLARQTARAVARVCHGAAVDLQAGQAFARVGNVRSAPRSEGEVISMLAMNWWSIEAPLQTEAAARELIRYFRAYLPEFLPDRYGPHEPLQFRFDFEASEPFYEYLSSESLVAGWKPRGRFFFVSYPAGYSARVGWCKDRDQDRFSAPHLDCMCPANLLGQPGWETALRRCWKAVSRIVKPFYADVRVLRGYPTTRNSFAYARDTEMHPISGWRGLPKTFGIATAIGPPYDRLLPVFVGGAEKESGLAFRSVNSWQDGGDVCDIVGLPPAELCQPTDYGWREVTCTRPDGGQYKAETLTAPEGQAAVLPFDPSLTTTRDSLGRG
ncbi:MAG: hypothetical protein O3A53_03405 [Acidobacteria bacterium]|nr:hypothetical protein [Acidobacteriota bacterium]MDA1233828.1 hypothetical protein [Acidobacteriota bacterium]